MRIFLGCRNQTKQQFLKKNICFAKKKTNNISAKPTYISIGYYGELQKQMIDSEKSNNSNKKVNDTKKSVEMWYKRGRGFHVLTITTVKTAKHFTHTLTHYWYSKFLKESAESSYHNVLFCSRCTHAHTRTHAGMYFTCCLWRGNCRSSC